MTAAVDDILLRPFNDVTRWAKCAVLQANESSTRDSQCTSLSRSSQSLLREGERALRRLSALLENPSPQFSEFLKDLALRNSDVARQVRFIEILLYDFEDFIGPETFERSKFDELQAATKELAISLIENITRFLTESALELSSPPSKFPPLPPLPHLPDTPRSGSRASARPSSNISTLKSVFSTAQRRPSFPQASEPGDGFRSAGRARRPVGYAPSPSASPFPISPGGRATPISVPLASQSTQKKVTHDYFETHRRQKSHSKPVVNGLCGQDMQAITPPSSIALSTRSTDYPDSISPIAKDSARDSCYDTLPVSVTTEPAAQLDWPSTIEQQPAFPDERATGYRYKGYSHIAEASTGDARSSIVTQGSGPSIRSHGRTRSGPNSTSISSSTTNERDSSSVRSTPCPKTSLHSIGPDSSLSLLGGFCKGARAFAAGGPGQAIKRVGGGSEGAAKNGDYSQEMFFGQMLATWTDSYADPVAQCLHCEYKSPYSQLLQDLNQDPLACQQAKGVVYRSRFLYKCHLAVRSINPVNYGCVFCDQCKSTIGQGDATVFQTVDLLFRHISRHSHPLPRVPGVTVAYGNLDAGARGRQDCDLYFANYATNAPYMEFPAGESDRIASLPVARAIKDHIRRRNEKPQERPDLVSEVLQFLAGARIIGVEFPDKWHGKWCQGWHDGVFGTFPSKIINLELPHHTSPATVQKTPRTGVVRWKFERQRHPGWLALKKGSTVYNLASNYHELWRWSTESINDFWMRVWEFTKVRAAIHPSYAISASETSIMTPTPTWFPEARLNFAQNMLESAYAPQEESGRPVLTAIREGSDTAENVTLAALRDRVGHLANAMQRHGIKPLDRVACIGSNSIETLTVFLAAASLGAIFTCSSPEMGERGILDRFLQVKPRILFAEDWTVYKGKKIACLPKADKIASVLHEQTGLEALVVIPRFGDEYRSQANTIAQSLARFTEGTSETLSFAQLKFSHPLIIVYSSGTTGKSKCLVHTVGGVLLKQKVEQILGMGLGPDSVYLQYTTTNWIMYLYSVSGLLSGARSILYDGNLMEPTPLAFLRILAREKVTHFGTSAHYLSLLEQNGITHENLPRIDALRVITSTGSVLKESQYHWVYRTFGSVQLSSIAGGTDIAGAFVGAASDLPVYAGWCQARALGMKVQIFSDSGEAIEASGEAGELVCTAPFPSQPAFFWGDEDGKRYKSAYFERYPGIWHQGDFVRMDPSTQGIQFLGRSDGVLNPSGVRFGSAEIYNALNAFPEIEDSLCVGQRRAEDKDERVLLFVKMIKDHILDHKLENAIRQQIRKDLSPRHVPKFIFETPGIPMTINGKKMELPVKQAVSGQKVVYSSTIANPDSLTWFKQFSSLDDSGNVNSKAKL
ncbi:hypothetical protein F66182_1312 [Fusarium sp. NRRL 66182]|nr:hypothetical protein F66182_1312 [Fusarium sp. NRRL 66182]